MDFWQSLVDDQRVENIDINGCDEVWVTYATPPGQEKRPPQRYRPLAATDDELLEWIGARRRQGGSQ